VKAGFVDTNGEWMKRHHSSFWYKIINGGVEVKYASLLCGAAVIFFLLCLTVFADENQDQQAAPAAPQAAAPPAATAPAAPAVTGTASVSFLNGYIFRGYQLGRDSFIHHPAFFKRLVPGVLGEFLGQRRQRGKGDVELYA
jgi:hypothetical protein